MDFVSVSRRTLVHLAMLPLLATPALAQDVQDDDDPSLDTIIVTGAMIRQGGAQDIKHFRSIALDDLDKLGLPQADGLTLEGLLGEHDLSLPSTGACAQLFCVSTHSMPASLAGREQDTQFLGIGFESGIDADAYRAEPLSLVAVVDRSGSMSGDPIARVKEGLHAVVDGMREGDRLGIVIYGSNTLVHQPVIDVESNRAALHKAIDAIGIDGATYMEAGLKLGFATAFEELGHSRGKTRLMLFTDENPNVGNTTPEGFMGQAIEGSRKGVGLTTIGVARHFDAALATKVSSVRGGNLFFLPREGSGSELFVKEFENMVSEVAQDLAISIDPAPGYKVSGVFGVPGDLITEASNGTVTVTIGSAFLSSNGGGIYATLSGEGSEDSTGLAKVSVAYTDVVSQERLGDSEDVLTAIVSPPANLAMAQMLVDQYLGVSEALALYHDKRDPRAAARLLAGLSERMAASGIEGLGEEQELVQGLQAKAAKLAELGKGKTLPFEVLGEWRVVRHSGVTDLSRGDLVEINEYGEFITERTRGPDAGDDIYQDFAINERQLHIEGTDLFLDYRVRGDRLTLRDRFDGVEIVMERDEG